MSRIELTDEEFAELFKEFPLVRKAKDGLPECPYCGNALNDDNLEIFGFQTEYGTEGTSFEIDCDVCRKHIWQGGSWGSDLDKAEALEDLKEELSNYKAFQAVWVRRAEEAK